MNGMKIEGLDRLMRRLKNLEGPGPKRALRKASRAAATVLGKAVKREVPVDKGLLKSAEATKVSVKGLSTWVGAGADVAKLNAQAEASAGKRPTNIDWLVEYGHLGADGTFVPPSGFMRRAAASQKNAQTVFVTKLASEIEKEATR